MGMTLPLAPKTSQPIGHKGQRGAVLVELKRAERLTARELASRLGASLNGVRHHLKELEAEGLVVYEREHRGVGAPAFAYRLSPSGQALFPRRYEETLTAVLDQLVEHQGREAAIAVLESYFGGLARRLQPELEACTSDERLVAVGRVLSEEGYMAEVSSRSGLATLTEHNCAIQAVAERFPEICAAEARFLEQVLQADVVRHAHMLDGCSACGYHVRFKSAQENS